MRVPFVKTCSFPAVADLSAVADLLPRGQWVSVDGRKGRLVGSLDGNAWVHWQDCGPTSADFARTCRTFHRAAAMPRVPMFRTVDAGAPSSPAGGVSMLRRVWAAWTRWIGSSKPETAGYSLHNARRV